MLGEEAIKWDGEASPRGRASTNLRQGFSVPNPYQVYEHAPQSPFKSRTPENDKGSAGTTLAGSYPPMLLHLPLYTVFHFLQERR